MSSVILRDHKEDNNLHCHPDSRPQNIELLAEEAESDSTRVDQFYNNNIILLLLSIDKGDKQIGSQPENVMTIELIIGHENWTN